MKNSFIFGFTKEVFVGNKGLQKQNHLVVFFPYKGILKSQSDFQIQLRDYFYQHTLPDKLVVICFEFNKDDVKELFKSDSDIYNYIPKFDFNKNQERVCVISLNGKGDFKSVIGSCPSADEIDDIFTRGMIKIFRKHGGLIISQPAHHFVFPSGKHSNRFLRTGNVLVAGTEIFFIAASLVKYFKKSSFESIYSDTSSINSLVYAYINLLKELNPSFRDSVHVESFGSYKMFEEAKFQARRNSLFLISSSTSGSILDRMTDVNKNVKNIELNNIAIIYGLSVKSPYNNQVICDLTKNKHNSDCIEPFESYNVNRGEVCKFCSTGSKALKVEGDVFLLEKPIVTSHLIKKTDLPIYIRDFSNYYIKSNKEAEPLIRCYHKENGFNDKKYEIYIDVASILDQWKNRDKKNHPYKLIFNKLEKYLLQNIPASLKYIITLPDDGSRKLASIINEILYPNGNTSAEILTLNELSKIDKNIKGSIVIASSSIVTGRNLLYLSRALRDVESSYRRLYFTFINRTGNKNHLDFLQSNLGLGEFGIDTHKIFNVETIHCSNEAQKTPWHIEEEAVKKFQEFFDNFEDFKAIINYSNERLLQLTQSGKNKGLSDNLFLPTIRNKVLKIRNGFAFAPFQGSTAHNKFISQSKQSEIYFIVSSILNDMRNKGIFDQSDYVRNILDPGNFVRFNDGIIQACLLRACSNDELDYSISKESSIQMQSVLGDMILHIEDDHAEALNEFFYAIAIKKLKLTFGIVEDCITLLEEQKFYRSEDTILKGLVKYIKKEVLVKEDIKSKFDRLIVEKINEE